MKMPDELEMKEDKELTLEEGIAAVEDTLSRLEEGGLSLEESFKLYKKGMELVKACGEKIDRVEKQILILEKENGEGSDDI